MNSHTRVDRSFQECIQPITSYIEVYRGPGFYMNTRSRKGNTPTATTDPVVDCGDLNVTRFGDLYPAYSMDSKVIYKNPECAKEDGVDDLIFWKAVLQCDIYDYMSKRQFSLSQFQITAVPPPTCRLWFVPPTEVVPLIEKDICYNEVIDTCKREVGSELMTNKEIIDACESGFFSPFIQEDVYANVFCFICNAANAFTVGENLCAMASPGGFEKTPTGTPALMTILKTNGNDKWSATKDKSHRIACLENEQTEQRCRPVLCSSGRGYNKHGDCDFYAEQWNGLRPKVTLSLHPAETMTTEELRDASGGQVPLGSWIKLPWPSSWHIATALSEETLVLESNETEALVTLTVDVVHERVTDFEAQTLFDEIAESIRKAAEICTPDRCVMAQQAISEYAEFTTNPSDSKIVPDWQVFDFSKYPCDRKANVGVSLLYFNRRFRDRWLNLGKTFLCDQIELEPTEFKLFGRSVLLYYESLKLMFYDNEFDLVLKENGNYTARVCMKDVGFSEYHANGGHLSAVAQDWTPLALLVTFATFASSM